MATIIKRKKAYSVVYYYTNEDGERKQKWETRHTYKEALKRKAEIENQLFCNTPTYQSNKKVSDLMYDFINLYGEKKWGVSTYDSNCALIANYINPIIGDLYIREISSLTADTYVRILQETKSVAKRNNCSSTEYLSSSSIEKIIKLTSCAFKQAVRWEMIYKNPFENVILPKCEYKHRDIWTIDEIKKALNACTDNKLYVAINLAFACSLRIGEILGLTWDNVHISDKNIAKDDAYIYIDKELTRASKRAIEKLGEKDIIYIFKPLMSNTSTRLILKKPKTKSSIRKVWLPKTVAYVLREWKKAQEELKSFLLDEYEDYNLVIALPNGRPCENRVLEEAFLKLKKEAELPNVVFHSLRHASATYKLKLNHGDLKATQGDTGHSQINMITDIYAHIIDEDRRLTAQKFENDFYTTLDLRTVRVPQSKTENNIDVNMLITHLYNNPDFTTILHRLKNCFDTLCIKKSHQTF